MGSSGVKAAVADAPPRPLWRNADFLLLWSGQAVSMLGSQVSTLALPLLVLAITHSATQAGLVTALRSVPYLIFSLPAGALIDRWNRKRVMILCDLARFLAYGSVPFVAALGQVTMAQLYLVALAEGTAFVFFNIAEIAALPRVVPTAQLAQANALNSSGESAAYLLGPGLGGWIIGLARTIMAGAALAYLVDSISYLVSVLSLGFIRVPFQAERAPVAGRSLRGEIAEGLRFLWTQRLIRLLALLTMSLNLLFSPIYLAAIVLAQQGLHADTRTIGLIFSLSSAGGLAGALVAPWFRARLRVGPLIIGSVLLQAVGAAVAAVAGSPAVLIIGGMLAFFTTPIYNVTSVSYRLALIPDELQGRVNSVFRLLAFGGQPLGAAVGGALLGPLGPRLELWLIAAGVALSALAVATTNLRRA